MPQAGFLPFKVPLDAKYRLQVPEQNTWDLDLLLSGCRNLGMIINLTKTDRYYDASVLSTVRSCREHGQAGSLICFFVCCC